MIQIWTSSYLFQVTQLQGVYGIHANFWTLCSNSYIGNVKLEVSNNVDAKYVIERTQKIFMDVGVQELFVQLDYEQKRDTYQNMILFPVNYSQ